MLICIQIRALRQRICAELFFRVKTDAESAGSYDHRGTEEFPGRVATLVPADASSSECGGLAYLVTPAVFEHLDHREKNGYLRIATELYFDNEVHALGLVYIASSENEAFLGKADEHDDERAIAMHIAKAHGPSGSNADYLLSLAEALRQLKLDDPHVFAIERHLKQILA
jgi:cation transport protein ChaC